MTAPVTWPAHPRPRPVTSMSRIRQSPTPACAPRATCCTANRGIRITATCPITNRMRASARPRTGRTRIRPSARRTIRASITARWRWRPSSPDSPTNRGWWSSPPPRRAPTASPTNSANARACITWTRASPNRMPWRMPPASRGRAAPPWWPPRRPSSNAPTTSSSRR